MRADGRLARLCRVRQAAVGLDVAVRLQALKRRDLMSCDDVIRTVPLSDKMARLFSKLLIKLIDKHAYLLLALNTRMPVSIA